MDEALIYDKMIRQHGYSIRRLAQKLGKDKGYLENRLRLADAPPEIRELVSVRKDTLSHAYELLKVSDPKKRKKLADMVARGELSLVKLREKIETTPRPARSAPPRTGEPETGGSGTGEDKIEADASAAWSGSGTTKPITEESLITVRAQLNQAMTELVVILQSDVMRTLDDTDRQNLAKYLTISKVRLENAITLVRRGAPGR